MQNYTYMYIYILGMGMIVAVFRQVELQPEVSCQRGVEDICQYLVELVHTIPQKPHTDVVGTSRFVC